MNNLALAPHMALGQLAQIIGNTFVPFDLRTKWSNTGRHHASIHIKDPANRDDVRVLISRLCDLFELTGSRSTGARRVYDFWTDEGHWLISVSVDRGMILATDTDRAVTR